MDKNAQQEEQEEETERYWMNSDTGHVIAMEGRPGRLWEEIDFDTYEALTHPGRMSNAQRR